MSGTSVHVRLGDEADSTLELVAASRGKTKSETAGELLEAALLGQGHALRVAAERYHRAMSRGILRDDQGATGK